MRYTYYMGCRISFVGLSGFAGSGKDLFFSLSKSVLKKEGIPCMRLSLADELKQQCDKTCKEMFGISATKCSREDKSKIRDFLVFYGSVMRKQTEGKHWTDLLNKRIKTIKRNLNTEQVKKAVCIVTDIRYSEYPEDETFWLKNNLKGTLIHISKYDKSYFFNGRKMQEYDSFVGSPNSSESSQDPKIKKLSDISLLWQHCEGNPLRNKDLKRAVKETFSQIGVIKNT